MFLDMPLQWMVGIEPDGEHDGPMRLAAWLSERSVEKPEILGVHVLPKLEIIDPNLGPDDAERLRNKARETCRWALTQAGAAAAVEQIELVDADAIEDGLREAILEHGPYACIVGRRALTEELRIQRLGPIARRMLRRLPAPLVVAPPDWRPSPGPIVLATDATDASLAAAGFARTLGQTIGAPVTAVHVARAIPWGGPYVEPVLVKQTNERLSENAARALHAWLEKHGVEHVNERVDIGDPVGRVSAVADELDSGLIVCGSRQLSTAARIFGHSVASELAATARTAVAVVPF